MICTTCWEVCRNSSWCSCLGPLAREHHLPVNCPAACPACWAQWTVHRAETAAVRGPLLRLISLQRPLLANRPGKVLITWNVSRNNMTFRRKSTSSTKQSSATSSPSSAASTQSSQGGSILLSDLQRYLSNMRTNSGSNPASSVDGLSFLVRFCRRWIVFLSSGPFGCIVGCRKYPGCAERP